jgi:nucleoid DNA-binding protein
MARAVNKDKLYRKVAKMTSVTKKEVEEVARAQFKFVAQTMASDTFDQVRLPFFGRFWVKENRLKHLQKFGLRVPKEEQEQDDDEPTFASK